MWFVFVFWSGVALVCFFEAVFFLVVFWGSIVGSVGVLVFPICLCVFALFCPWVCFWGLLWIFR